MADLSLLIELRRGLYLIYKRQYKEAENLYRELDTHSPNTSVIINNIGYCLLMQKRKDDAIPYFLRALELDQTNDIARQNLRLAKSRYIARSISYTLLIVFIIGFFVLHEAVLSIIAILFVLAALALRPYKRLEPIRNMDRLIESTKRQQERERQEELLRLERERQEEQLRQAQQQWTDYVMSSGIFDIDRMTGEEFERRMATHFEYLGWRVETTPGSGDYGADLVLYPPDGRKVVAQCKRYTGPVGISAVQEVLGAIQYYKAHSGFIITNSSLTNNALRLAEASGIDIWDRQVLIAQLADAYNEWKLDRFKQEQP